MVQMAATGKTLEEIAKTFSLPTDKQELQLAFRETLRHLKTRRNILTTANKIVVKNDFDLSPSFVKLANNSFNAEIELQDFSKPEECAKNINHWIENKTNKTILEVVKPEMFTSLTELFLINALYFKGKWENPFSSELTRARKFYTNSTNEVMVDTMYTVGDFGYFDNKELEARLINLPYLDNEFTMTLALPNDKDGLPKLEANIQKVIKHKELKVYPSVTVMMPKFRVEKNTDLKDILMKVSFSGINKSAV